MVGMGKRWGRGHRSDHQESPNFPYGTGQSQILTQHSLFFLYVESGNRLMIV